MIRKGGTGLPFEVGALAGTDGCVHEVGKEVRVRPGKRAHLQGEFQY